MFRTVSLVFAGAIICLFGCGKEQAKSTPTNSTSIQDAGAVSATKTAAPEGPPSEVSTQLPDLEGGSTHAFYAQGTFNALAHDSRSPFQFDIDGQLKYRFRLRFDKFVQGEWALIPQLEVTNETESKMYTMLYAAYFDDEDRLVGCCHQGLESEPNGRPTQMASLIVSGPKTMLAKATNFRLVLYESDKRIGVAPTLKSDDPESEDTRKVATELTNITQVNIPQNGYSELRLDANISARDIAEHKRNTHVKLKGATTYDCYVSMRTREVLLTRLVGKEQAKKEERFNSWGTSIEFDPVKRVKGMYALLHAALLNDEGQLVVCTTKYGNSSLPVPSDKLLSATQLKLVAHEFEKQAK